MKKFFCIVLFLITMQQAVAQRPAAILVVTDTTENYRRPLPVHSVIVNIQDGWLYRLTSNANTSNTFETSSKVKIGSIVEMQHVWNAISDTLDYYYLQSETQNVIADSLLNYARTDRANSFSGTQQMLSDLIVSGNLSVLGDVDSVNVEQVSTSDNTIILNDGETSSEVTAGFSGLIVDRGTSPFYFMGYVAGKGLVLAEIDSVCNDSIYTNAKLLAVRENSTEMTDLGIPYWDADNYSFHTDDWLEIDTASQKILQNDKSWNENIHDSLIVWNPVSYVDVYADDTLHTRVSNNQGVFVLLDSAKVFADSSSYIESQINHSYGNSNKYDYNVNSVTTSTASNQQLTYIHNDSISDYYNIIELRGVVWTTSDINFYFRRFAVNIVDNTVETLLDDNTSTTLGTFSLSISATDNILIEFSPNQSDNTNIRLHYTIYRLL